LVVTALTSGHTIQKERPLAADLTARPRARAEGLTVDRLESETLVYDADAREAHCLNGPAALVWEYCDGSTTIEEMVARLSTDTGEAVDADVVLFALHQLGERALLAAPEEVPSAKVTSRRELLVKLGGAAIALPVVTSILAPTSAAAQSGGQTGQTGQSSSGSSSGGSSSGSSGSSGSSSGGSS